MNIFSKTDKINQQERRNMVADAKGEPREEDLCVDREALIDHLILHTFPLLRAEISDLKRKVDVAHSRIDKLILQKVKSEE